MGKIVVAVSENGKRLGQSHHNAKLTDAEVDLLLELRQEDKDFWTYTRLAEKFEISKSCVRFYVTGERRAQVAFAYRTVHVSEEGED